MISIFGTQPPKFIANFGMETEAEVLLDHWLTNKDEADSKETIIESELSCDRQIIPRGDNWIFSGTVNLFKYGTRAEITNKFEEIYAYNREEVVLYRHRDGTPLKDDSGNEVLCYMTVVPKHYASLLYYDLLVVEFRTLTGVNFSSGVPVRKPLSEIKIVGMK